MAVVLELVVCEGPTCAERAGGAALRPGISRLLADRGLGERVAVTSTICFGHCQRAPNLLICPRTDEAPASAASARWQGVARPGDVLVHGISAATVSRLERLLDSQLSPDAASTRGCWRPGGPGSG